MDQVGEQVQHSPLPDRRGALLRLAEALLAPLREPVLLEGADGRIAAASEGLTALTGRRPGELVGLPVTAMGPYTAGQADGVRPMVVNRTPVVLDDDEIGHLVTFERPGSAGSGLDKEVARLSAIVASSFDATIGASLDGAILSWDRGAERLFGFAGEDALGQPLAVVVPDRSLSELEETIEGVRRGNRLDAVDTVLRTASGHEVEVSITVSPVHDAVGDLVGVSVVARDLGLRRAIGRQLLADDQVLAEIDGRAHVASFVLELENGELSWSSELNEMLGVAPDADAGIDLYLRHVPLQQREQLEELLAEALEGGAGRFEHDLIASDGSERRVAGHFQASSDGRRSFGVIVDITPDGVHEARPSDPMHDAVTGLANRLLLDDRLAVALAAAAAHDERLAVLFIDIDRFTAVNEAFGHGVGDAVLGRVASRLQATVTEAHTLARFGGDTFVVLLEDVTDHWTATQTARRIAEAVEDPIPIDGQDIRLTACVGVAVSDLRDTPAAVLGRADSALGRAKDRGANRIESDDPAAQQRAIRRFDLERSLRDAIAARQLELHYQPVIAVRTGALCGVEALLRWRRTDGTLLPPVEFIPVAEETGLIVEMGSWVIEQGLHDLGDLQRHLGPDLWLALNVSPRQLEDPSLFDVLHRTLHRTGVSPSTVHLELTESVLMDDVDRSVSALAGLRTLGVRAVVDDFGTGYSSLSYLQRLPLDALKIDGSFVRELERSETSLSIVRAIVNVADALALDLVAECVETEEQRAQLEALGCSLGQGYLWSPALPLAALRVWISDRQVEVTTTR